MLIPETEPMSVWKYMADFSNYKLLNPHLMSWQLLSESSSKRQDVSDMVQYTVRYTEMFEHIPMLTNTATGNFTVFQHESNKVAHFFPIIAL